MKRLLIVVDYQNDFVDGALGFPGAEQLDGPIAAKIAEYRAAGDVVAYTFDTHHENYLETQEGANLPVVHCIEGTPGHGLYGTVAQTLQPTDQVFYKPAFGSAELFEWLRAAQLEADAKAEVQARAEEQTKGGFAAEIKATAASEAEAGGEDSTVVAGQTTQPFKSIELVGLVSNICVVSNAILAKAACPEVPVIVDAACTASNDPAMNEAALDVMQSVQITVLNR